MERSLSQEEQEELARTNKKVKDVSHAGFSEGQYSGASSPSHNVGPWNHSVSFKEKLVGDIPSAYTQVFSFGDLMEDDVDSNEELEALRQGFVDVKFSKDFKQQIRRPWAKAFIVKVYGRAVGFHFLQEKLLAMWKPAGPWFIRGHFLSIRPWEPNFRASSANVSFIALWIRLNELPIQYYNAEALHHIGAAISNVLRVDTFIVFETRGRFDRLCVQVDVEKPLATTIMIAKLEQPISYKGIHKLCFGCGRMGHRKENCPYVIRHEVTAREVMMKRTKTSNEKGESSHETNVTNSPRLARGPTKYVHATIQDAGDNEKGEFKSKERHDMDRAGVVIRPKRDIKRKLVAPKKLDTAQFVNATKKIGKEVLNQTQMIFMQNQDLSNERQMPMELASARTSSKPNSVKGKRIIMRIRAFKSDKSNAIVSESAIISSAEDLKKGAALLVKERNFGDGGSSSRTPGILQLATSTWSKVGFKFGRCDSGNTQGGLGRESSKSNSDHRVFQGEAEESMEVRLPRDGAECRVRLASNDRFGLELNEMPFKAEVVKGTTNIHYHHRV
nr:hypothetical protein CFP56_36069 [Quercus suber]